MKDSSDGSMSRKSHQDLHNNDCHLEYLMLCVRVIIRQANSMTGTDTDLTVRRNSWTCTSWSKRTARSGVAKLNNVCTASISS